MRGYKKLKNFLLILKKTIFLNPIWLLEHTIYKKLRELILSCNINNSEKWLDVGCGTRPYEHLFPQGVYFGVDVEESGREVDLKLPDLFYDGKTLPFPDASFDGVISTEVLEHVPDQSLLLLEIARVLRPGGSLILSVPFVYEEHEKPFDFFRFTQFGITELLAKANFEVSSIIKDTNAILTIAMLTNVYISTSLIPKIKIRGVASMFILILCFPVQVLAIVLSKSLPDSGNLYMNIIAKAKKV